MAILVSGGAGYIGSHTCIELLNAGYDIVVADNFYNSCPVVLDRIKQITGKDFRFYEADMTRGGGFCTSFSGFFQDNSWKPLIFLQNLFSLDKICAILLFTAFTQI